ncbi:MAG: hypothetical protein ACM3L6_08105, partial [Deltaproteobacteria bacterium]
MFLRGKDASPIIHVLIIILVAGVVYAPSLSGHFVYDDLILVRDNPYIRSFHHVPEIFSTDIGAGASAAFTFYRPLQMLT